MDIEESINNKIDIAKNIQGAVSVPERAVVMTAEPISISGGTASGGIQGFSFNANVNLNK